MANPARALHEIYEDWRSRLTKASTSLIKVINLDTVAGASEVAKAARALVRIDEVLTMYEVSGRYNVSLYRRQYPEWWKGVVSYQNGWKTAMSGQDFIQQPLMDEIEGFGNFLEGKVFELEPESEKTLREIIRDARDALEADQGLSGPIRMYIHRLLQEIEWALNNEGVKASFDFGEAADRLYVAFAAAQGEGTAKATLWENLKTNIIPASLINGAVAIGGAAVMRALGM